MFECIPAQPHHTNCNLEDVITSFRKRFEELRALDGIHITIPAVPFLGTTAKQ
jgi:hypothetical protein